MAKSRVHSKQDVFDEGLSTRGGADPAAHMRGGADPATSTNSTGSKGKLRRTPVRNALYNVPDEKSFPGCRLTLGGAFVHPEPPFRPHTAECLPWGQLLHEPD